MKRLLGIGVLLGLAACGVAPVADGRAPPTRAGDPCGAEAIAPYVGQGLSALAAFSFDSARTRFIYPGDAVTEDHSPERLNILFDRSERIARAYCG